MPASFEAELQRPKPARLRAALRSAFAEYLHCLHKNVSLVGRLARSQCPQTEHVFEVFRGSTVTTGTPASAALYSTNAGSDPKKRLVQPPLAARRSPFFQGKRRFPSMEFSPG